MQAKRHRVVSDCINEFTDLFGIRVVRTQYCRQSLDNTFVRILINYDRNIFCHLLSTVDEQMSCNTGMRRNGKYSCDVFDDLSAAGPRRSSDPFHIKVVDCFVVPIPK